MPHPTVTDAPDLSGAKISGAEISGVNLSGAEPAASKPAASKPARPRRDWPGLFLRAVVSLFLGLPLGGVLFALTGLGIALVNDDPLLQHPWLLAFRTLAAAVSYVFLGGFAWTPEGGYESLHAWYAAGVVLAFVLMSRPWRRWTQRQAPEAWPRKA